MGKAGLVAPWNWREWQELPADFVEGLLMVSEVTNEAIAAEAETRNG